MNERREERANERVRHGPNPRAVTKDPVKERKKCTVADRVVAPRVPNGAASEHDIVRIAEPRRDALGAEVVIVTIPDGLARPGDRHVKAWQESEGEHQRREREVAMGRSAFEPRDGPAQVCSKV